MYGKMERGKMSVFKGENIVPGVGKMGFIILNFAYPRAQM